MITGDILRLCFSHAAGTIPQYQQHLNHLNVFPVADKDTGTNLSATLGLIASSLSTLPSGSPVSLAAGQIFSSAVTGAKGNSGTIFSLLLSGLPNACSGQEAIPAAAFARALSDGERTARSSIQNPAEGTMLTVCRAAAKEGLSCSETQPALSDCEVLRNMCTAACCSAAESMSQNPILSASQVIDSGALGFCIFLDAFASTLQNVQDANTTLLSPENTAPSSDTDPLPLSAEVRALLPELVPTSELLPEDALFFPFCTEFTLIADNASEAAAQLGVLLAPLGDCLLINHSENRIKIHLHTAQPVQTARILGRFGVITHQKAENMRTQMMRALPASHPEHFDAPYVIAGCGGDGFAGLFADLNADYLLLEPALECGVPAAKCGSEEIPVSAAEYHSAEMLLSQTLALLPKNHAPVLFFPNRPSNAENLKTDALPSDAFQTIPSDTEADCCNVLLLMSVGMFDPHSSAFDCSASGVARAVCLDTMEPEKVIAQILACPKERRSITRLYYGRNVSETEIDRLDQSLKKAFPDSGSVTLLSGGQETPLYLSFLPF